MKRWFKIWLSGSNGPHPPDYVYWEDSKDDWDIHYMIERELGPYCEGIRSSNFRRIARPPKKILEKRIETLKYIRRNALSEMKKHLDSLNKG